jgi:hypothetical protein
MLHLHQTYYLCTGHTTTAAAATQEPSDTARAARKQQQPHLSRVEHSKHHAIWPSNMIYQWTGHTTTAAATRQQHRSQQHNMSSKSSSNTTARNSTGPRRNTTQSNTAAKQGPAIQHEQQENQQLIRQKHHLAEGIQLRAWRDLFDKHVIFRNNSMYHNRARQTEHQHRGAAAVHRTHQVQD